MLILTVTEVVAGGQIDGTINTIGWNETVIAARQTTPAPQNDKYVKASDSVWCTTYRLTKMWGKLKQSQID
jgi:hypothetical protein